MAVRSRSTTLHFLVLFIILSSLCFHVHCLQQFAGFCGQTVDMVNALNIQSGVLKMSLPDTMEKYQNPTHQLNCDIILQFTSGTFLLVELYFLDIMPKSGDLKACSTGLEIFDQTQTKYYGGRLCMEGWQWEERHREKNQEKMIVKNSPLTIRLISEGPYRGEGFKLHFNQFRPYWPCYTREFKCRELQRCVHDDLTCDGWDDCGDYSDERIDAGCDLLTASEICSLIMGILLLLGAAAECVIFFIAYRRKAVVYGVRSESKVPISEDKYNMEPVFGSIGRRYNSQDSIPSRFSRSTVPTMIRHDSDADTVDKADLERADRQELQPLTGSRMSGRTGDNMSERSYRSNPRRTIVQPLGFEAVEPIKKSGQYSYGSRKGLNSSHSSEKVDQVANAGDRGSLEKERLGSRERLSDRDRKYGRDRDRYSDSDEYDRDRYDDDRRRRSSRERDRRRSDRYSDEDDSDYDRDRDYRRRRRRSYDRYSDDSDYEYERERERRRRSRERYSRDRYDDEDDSGADRERGIDEEKDRDKPSSRRSSRERNRNRDRYSRDRYDDDDTDKDRDLKKDKDEKSSVRGSRERDRDRYRDSYDEDKGLRRGPDDDEYDDRRARRRRSEEKRRGPSAERDKLEKEKARNEKMRSRSRENIQQRERDMPPPYTEEDSKRIQQQNEKQSSLGDGKKSTGQQNQPLPPPSDAPRRAEQQFPSAEDLRRIEQQIQKPASSDKKSLDSHNQRAPPSADVKSQGQKPTSSDKKSLDSHNQRAPPPPPSADVKSQGQKPASNGADPKRLASQNQKPPPKEIDEVDRRKSTDDRRDRYSRSRWNPKKKSEDIPPPEYEDVAPKSTFVGISYKEESV